MQRMKAKAVASLPECQFVSWDVITTFEEFKKKGDRLPDDGGCFGLVGNPRFRNDQGTNVPWKDVVR